MRHASHEVSVDGLLVLLIRLPVYYSHGFGESNVTIPAPCGQASPLTLPGMGFEEGTLNSTLLLGGGFKGDLHFKGYFCTKR